MAHKLSREVWIVAAKRTAFGAFSGALKDLSATDLAVEAAKAALVAGKVSPERVNSVFFGNVQQTSRDAIYLARHVGLRSGVPIPVPALTVNRLCGSGFEAIVQGAQSHPPRRVRGRARRWHRVHVAGAARHLRRAYGSPLRPSRVRCPTRCGTRSPIRSPACPWP